MGPIDILINNVGNREVSVSIEAEPLETWQRQIDLNLTSCFLGTKIIGGAMLARGTGGRIINIASISALIVNRGIGGRDYETGKAAVLHFTRCAAADWAPSRDHGQRDLPRPVHDRHQQGMEREASGRDRGVRQERADGARRASRTRSARLPCISQAPRLSYVTGAAYVIDGGYTVW